MPSAKSLAAGCVVSASRSSASRPRFGLLHARGRLDQLGQRPHRHQQLERVRRWPAGPPLPPPRSGRGRCRARQPPSARRPPCPALRPSACSIALAISAEASASLPCKARSISAVRARSGCRWPPPRCRPRPASAAPAEVSVQHAPCPTRRGDGSSRQRAGIADELDLPHRDRVQAVVVPYRRRGRRGHPAPAQHVLHRECRRRRFAARCNSAPPPRVRRSISRARPSSSRSDGRGAPGRPREVQDGAGDVQQDAAVPARCPATPRRAPGVEVGLARELEIEWLEPLRGL